MIVRLGSRWALSPQPRDMEFRWQTTGEAPLLMSGTEQGEKVDSKSQLLSARLSLRSKAKTPWDRAVFCLPTLVMASPGMGA